MKRMEKIPTELTVTRSPAKDASRSTRLLKANRGSVNFASSLVLQKRSTQPTTPVNAEKRRFTRRNYLEGSLVARAQSKITSARPANRRKELANTKNWHANFVLVAKAAAAEAAAGAEVPRIVVIPVSLPVEKTPITDSTTSQCMEATC